MKQWQPRSYLSFQFKLINIVWPHYFEIKFVLSNQSFLVKVSVFDFELFNRNIWKIVSGYFCYQICLIKQSWRFCPQSRSVVIQFYLHFDLNLLFLKHKTKKSLFSKIFCFCLFVLNFSFPVLLSPVGLLIFHFHLHNESQFAPRADVCGVLLFFCLFLSFDTFA